MYSNIKIEVDDCLPNLSVSVGKIEYLEWDNRKGCNCAQRKQDIVNTTWVYGAERRYDESGLRKRMIEGRVDGAVETSDGVDAVDGKLNGERVFDCGLCQISGVV